MGESWPQLFIDCGVGLIYAFGRANWKAQGGYFEQVLNAKYSLTVGNGNP